jgi:hypothetical protein
MHEDLLMILVVAELSHATKCGVKRGENLAPRLDDAEAVISLSSMRANRNSDYAVKNCLFWRR